MPTGVYARKLVPLEDRFWPKVDKSGRCWLWTAATDGKGYPHFGVNHRMRKAHRLAYEWAKGPIPVGLEIDHLCRVRRCVNPDHLEAVTHLENIRRGLSGKVARRRRTSCRRGHPYSGPNLRVTSSGGRRCRTCDRMRETKP